MSRETCKPCHGCGGTRFRDSNKVCDDCATLLSIGRAVKMEEERKADRKRVTLFRLVPDWPHFFVRDDAARRRLVEAFKSLSRHVLRLSRSKAKPYDKGVVSIPVENKGRTLFTTFYEKALVYEGPKVVGEAIDELDLAVRGALRARHNEGLKEGGDLLAQLARGEITVAKLNEETLRSEA